jgi:hypothetical protein
VKRVERTRSHGAWRDWWTREDIRLIRPVLQPFLDIHYPDGAWELAVAPQLRPEHGSAYVARIANERRAVAGMPPFAWDG